MGIKYSVNEKFFDTWSPDMAYILGYLYADGGLENSPSIRGKYIRFTSTDKEIIQHTKKLLKSNHSIIQIVSSVYKTRYLLRIGNAKLYNSVTQHGITPRKSHTMEFPDVPDDLLPHFVRGYFDGDGCVSIEHYRLASGKLGIKRLHTSFTSGSKNFLLHLSAVLEVKIGITSKIYTNTRSHQIRYSTKSSSQLFIYLYRHASRETCLHRKLTVFKNFFKVKEHWIDSSIQSILSRTSWWRSG